MRMRAKTRTSAREVLFPPTGTPTLDAMYQAIDAAQRQVLLEMYWFDDDSVGTRFAQALAALAERGVQVAVMYDALGSRGHAAAVERLRTHGVHVVAFNPIHPWRKRFRWSAISIRDHRKLLVVDEEVAFLGGTNLAEEWLDDPPDRVAWRDDAVRLTGPCVPVLADGFHWLWRRQGGPALPRQQVNTSPGKFAVDVLQQTPFRRRHISRTLKAMVRTARQRIWIANAYFLPPSAFVRALRRAAKRGVDVRVVVPMKSDVRVVDWASHFLYDRLLRVGISVYEYIPTHLHSKTMLVDSAWVTTGSFNLDHRSHDTSHELNVGIAGTEVAAAVEQRFERDFEQCHRVELHARRFRSIAGRILEALCYLFRRWL